MSSPRPGTDTPTGTDPDAKWEHPGYEDKSLGQAVDQDRELVDRLLAETGDEAEAARRFQEESAGAPALQRQASASGDDRAAAAVEALDRCASRCSHAVDAVGPAGEPRVRTWAGLAGVAAAMCVVARRALETLDRGDPALQAVFVACASTCRRGAEAGEAAGASEHPEIATCRVELRRCEDACVAVLEVLDDNPPVARPSSAQAG
jgi:hypothetical protein